VDQIEKVIINGEIKNDIQYGRVGRRLAAVGRLSAEPVKESAKIPRSILLP